MITPPCVVVFRFGQHSTAAPANTGTQTHPEAAARLEQHNREAGRCTLIEEGWMWSGEGPLPLAACWDGSEYKAGLFTHESFGCVLWERTAEGETP